MSEEQVLTGLIVILKECQKAFGHDDGDFITSDTVPHGGLKGFQSDATPTIVPPTRPSVGQPVGG